MAAWIDKWVSFALIPVVALQIWLVERGGRDGR